MIDLVTDKDREEIKNDSSTAQTELDTLMSEYKDAAIVESSEEKTENELPNENDIPADSELRFKRGKKKGQLRPNWQELWKAEQAKKKAIEEQKESTFQPSQNQIISGAVIIVMIDIIIPAAASVVASRFFDKELPAEKLKLTDTERKDLIPLADGAAAYLKLEVNPVAAFIITLISIYTAKILQ